MKSSPKRVLIVSSESHIVRLIEVNMARQGYGIGVAFSGHEALALLAAERFDIAAIDCKQVDMTGRELIARIRENPDWAHIKFIFLSDKGVEDIDEVDRANISIVSPPPISKFLRSIRASISPKQAQARGFCPPSNMDRMNLRSALKEQYHAALAMLADCVEKCPDDLWTTPNPRNDGGDRVIYRPFWRIAFHAVYFTHLYLGQNEAAFRAPDLRVSERGEFDGMWGAPWNLEPYELPEDVLPASKAEILEYIAFVKALVDPTVDGLDLETNDSGFSWYPKMSKLSHQLLNLRHLQGHIGQLSELLWARGVETDWVS